MSTKKARLHRQLMSKKILGYLLDDFSLFGSLPFYLLVMAGSYFIGNIELFLRLAYCLLITIIIILTIKNIHFKDRPQKEEFNILMEKVIASSFPSTHSMNITILTVLLSLAYPLPWLIAIFSALALLVYIQRYITKKHFIMDIMGGIFIGMAEVIFVIKVL